MFNPTLPRYAGALVLAATGLLHVSTPAFAEEAAPTPAPAPAPAPEPSTPPAPPPPAPPPVVEAAPAPAAPAPAADAPAAVAAPAAPAAPANTPRVPANSVAAQLGGNAGGDTGPVRFGALSLDLSLSDSSGINAVGENYQNNWSLYIGPTWRPGHLFFKDNQFLRGLNVSARWIVSGEFAGTGDNYRVPDNAPENLYAGCTNQAPSTEGGKVDVSNLPYCQNGGQRRADWSDITLRIADSVYTVPVAQIGINLGLGAAIPVSRGSRYANLITTLSPSVGLNRPFFEGKLTLSYGLAFTKFFYSKSTPTVNFTNSAIDDPNNPQLSAGNGATSTDLGRFARGVGPLSNDYSFNNQFVVAFQATEQLSFNGLYVLGRSFRHEFESCSAVVQGQTVDLCNTTQAVADRSGATVINGGNSGSQVFQIGATFQANDWFGVNLSMTTAGGQRNYDSSWRIPFFRSDYNNYTSLGLSLNFSVDGLASTLIPYRG